MVNINNTDKGGNDNEVYDEDDDALMNSITESAQPFLADEAVELWFHTYAERYMHYSSSQKVYVSIVNNIVSECFFWWKKMFYPFLILYSNRF